MSDTPQTITLSSNGFCYAPGMAQNIARAWSIGDHNGAWIFCQAWASAMPGWALGQLLQGQFTIDKEKETVTLTEPAYIPGSKGLLDIFTIRPVKTAKRGRR